MQEKSKKTGGKAFLSFLKKPGALIIAFLLLINIFAMSVSLARYISGKDSDLNAGSAVFSPAIQCGSEWNWVGDIPVGGTLSEYCLPFVIDLSKNEVRSILVVTVETDDVLPLGFLLYACAPADVSDEYIVARDDSVSTDKKHVFRLVCPAGAEARTFSVAMTWQSELDGEYFNGLRDRLHLTVVCEQYVD